jgi:hypothetical protein
MPNVEIECAEIRLKEGPETPRNNRAALFGIETAARGLEGGIREPEALSSLSQERKMRDVALTTAYLAIVMTAMAGWVWMLFSSVEWLLGV